ncbi:hypothetical protein GCM10008927_28200 [Amylibacter ulvae]|uniref:Uncharacterized protein n=1 Tax=Paramylibacter ulvae TaxID=1651968 RepID=A0ABQ3DBQ3_9RHOB|nr:hypothetical protein [Amylibacter ulvae]GHA61113.1 hypothetical protein GCM10008927_28200 [Amylibacter ulvae]
MQKLLFALSLGFGVVIMMAQHSTAQTRNCATRGKVVESLNDQYGETRRSIGLGQNNGVVELYTSDNTGTWTILVTLPNGMSCLMAAGDAFEFTDNTVQRGAPT